MHPFCKYVKAAPPLKIYERVIFSVNTSIATSIWNGEGLNLGAEPTRLKQSLSRFLQRELQLLVAGMVVHCKILTSTLLLFVGFVSHWYSWWRHRESKKSWPRTWTTRPGVQQLSAFASKVIQRLMTIFDTGVKGKQVLWHHLWQGFDARQS